MLSWNECDDKSWFENTFLCVLFTILPWLDFFLVFSPFAFLLLITVVIVMAINTTTKTAETDIPMPASIVNPKNRNHLWCLNLLFLHHNMTTIEQCKIVLSYLGTLRISWFRSKFQYRSVHYNIYRTSMRFPRFVYLVPMCVFDSEIDLDKCHYNLSKKTKSSICSELYLDQYSI